MMVEWCHRVNELLLARTAYIFTLLFTLLFTLPWQDLCQV